MKLRTLLTAGTAPLIALMLAAVQACSSLMGISEEPGGAERLEEGRRHIERISGCFEVTYRYAEDGTHDLFSEDYGLVKPIVEWVGIEEVSRGVFHLPHVSVFGSRAVPHFYEVWTYRSETREWTQEIWSHTPKSRSTRLRYKCTAPWQQNSWACRAGRAKKPFRDSGAPFGFDRTDYDWLDRTNFLLVTPKGWIHNQRNRKVRNSGEVVAHELGWITYRRINAVRCELAQRRLEK